MASGTEDVEIGDQQNKNSCCLSDALRMQLASIALFVSHGGAFDEIVRYIHSNQYLFIYLFTHRYSYTHGHNYTSLIVCGNLIVHNICTYVFSILPHIGR